MHIKDALVDNLSAGLREAVYDTADQLLIAGHRRGGENYGVARQNVNAGVRAAGHAG